MNFHEQLNELIAQRALHLSEMRDNAATDPVENWIQAEQEIYRELNLRADKIHEAFGTQSEEPFPQ